MNIKQAKEYDRHVIVTVLLLEQGILKVSHLSTNSENLRHLHQVEYTETFMFLP